MRRLVGFAVVAWLTAVAPAVAQNCVTVNGISRCTQPWQIYDSAQRQVSLPVLDLTQIWNQAATTFTGVKLNVTDTTSASGSLLLDLQVGGTSKFSVNKSGNVVAAGTFTPTGVGLFPDGSASAPSVALASETGLGFFRSSTGYLGVANDNGLSTTMFTFGTTAFNLGSGTAVSWGSTAAAPTGAAGDTSLGRASAGVVSVNSVPTVAFVTSDFSTASVSLATITGLSWTLPANIARNIPFSCKLYYSQATAAVADAFGFQVATVAPTNAQVGGAVETALGTTAYGDATFTTTTAANVVAFTPSAISTIFNAYLDGFIEAPSNGSIATVNIMALTGNASDSITVKRGSFCRIY